MDAWGPDGCREHFNEIVEHVREQNKRFTSTEKLAAAMRAAITGQALSINWIDPFPSLVRLAIRRAETAAPNL
ncbi:MAG TPA: hypothetical protein VFW87_09485 [Pirellulales bacterium]|nr:hypothetical protein [Pirellulales bacterium]